MTRKVIKFWSFHRGQNEKRQMKLLRNIDFLSLFLLDKILADKSSLIPYPAVPICFKNYNCHIGPVCSLDVTLLFYGENRNRTTRNCNMLSVMNLDSKKGTSRQ